MKAREAKRAQLVAKFAEKRAELHQAVERHTQSWQRLLEQCGMRPGVESK